MKAVFNELPAGFVEKLKKIYPNSFPKICETFLHRKEQTFRINCLRTDLPRLREDLDREGIKYRELHRPKGSFILRSPLKEFQKSRVYIDGRIYMQNVSSMMPPIVLDLKPGEKVLDLCAAPGAKTSQIASMTGGEAEIIAVEKLEVRYQKLLATLKLQGADAVKALFADGASVRKDYAGYFDKVLVDAPCSGEALFYMRDPKTFRPWSQRRVKDLAHTQRDLLYSGITALRAGGELVYSTCTFSPEENEEAVNWALGKFKDIKLLPADIPVTEKVRGLAAWDGAQFDKSLGHTVRILPNEYLEGFFIARFKKEKR